MIDVTIILPIHNAAEWLNDALSSILSQKFDNELKVELSCFLDSCSDDSEIILRDHIPELEERGIKVLLSKEDNGEPKGAGYAKNKAIFQSSGRFLCFADADDVMLPSRLQLQYNLAVGKPNCLVGSKFRRDPIDSTARFTRWANSLNGFQLNNQIYTSNGPTVIMPTWFCQRDVVRRVGGFCESGRNVPEDLFFFYEHLRLGGCVARVDEELVVYRYHLNATTFSIDENTIWSVRVKELETRVLTNWDKFTIWNAGKQGRKLYRTLSPLNRSKVSCFCDVDRKKIGQFYTDELSNSSPKPRFPIVHFRDAEAPLVICVKLDLSNGSFEENLASLKLSEGVDYHLFS